MSVINLLHPGMLLGLALVGLPVAAHFLNRQAKRTLVFPTIELLIASSASQSQMFKFRRWFLLLLRALAVLCIVLAFCRPQLEKHLSPAGQTSKDGAHVLIMFDRSLSMSQISNGTPAIDTLKARLLKEIDSLSSGNDKVNMVFMDVTPKLASKDYTRNLDLIRKEIRALTVSNGFGDVGATLALAGNSLKNTPGNRHLIIVSDLQESNWKDYAAETAIKGELPEGTQVTLLSLRTKEADNIGLSAPDVIPSRPLVGESCLARVTVTNSSPHEEGVIVELYERDTLIESRAVRLGPWNESLVGFKLKIDDADSRQLRFKVQDDALQADNVAYLPISPAKHIPVVILGTDNPNNPGSSSYFLSRTLAPYSDRGNRYRVTTKSTTAFTLLDALDTDIVILSDSAPVEKQLKDLEHLVKQGGKLIIFTGNRFAGKTINLLESAAKTPVFPFAMTTYDNLRSIQRFSTISRMDQDNPLFKDYDQSARSALSQIHIWKRWITVPRKGVIQHNILEYPDGCAAGCIVQHGKGQIALLNFSPEKSASDLAQHGTFVALIQSLVGYFQNLSGKPPTYLPNDFVQIQLPNMKGIEELPILRAPDDAVIPSVDFYKQQGRQGLSVQETGKLGFYNVLVNTTNVTCFAVNCDSRESDLRRKTIVPGNGLLHGEMSVKTAGINHRLPDSKPHPIWGWMLLAALCFLAAEAVLLRVWIREGTL